MSTTENTEEKEQDIVNQGVESRIFVPYTGKISEIHMLDSGKEVAFTEADGGLTLTIPAGYRQGSALSASGGTGASFFSESDQAGHCGARPADHP